METVDNRQGQVGGVSRKMETPRKKKREMIEIETL